MKLNSLAPCKMDAWETTQPFWDGLFSEDYGYVSCREDAKKPIKHTIPVLLVRKRWPKHPKTLPK